MCAVAPFDTVSALALAIVKTCGGVAFESRGAILCSHCFCTTLPPGIAV